MLIYPRGRDSAVLRLVVTKGPFQCFGAKMGQDSERLRSILADTLVQPDESQKDLIGEIPDTEENIRLRQCTKTAIWWLVQQ